MATCARRGCGAQAESPVGAWCAEHEPVRRRTVDAEPAKPEPCSRSSGERVRLHHQLRRITSTLNGLMLSVEDNKNPPGPTPGEALQTITTEIVTTLARLDAYMRAEADAAPPVPGARCPHCGSTDLEPVEKPKHGERCRTCRYRWSVIPPGSEDSHG